MPNLLVGDIPFTLRGIHGQARGRLLRTLEGAVAEAADLLDHAIAENGDVAITSIAPGRPHVLAAAIRLNDDYTRSERAVIIFATLSVALFAAFMAAAEMASRPGHNGLFDYLATMIAVSAFVVSLLSTALVIVYFDERSGPVGKSPAGKLLTLHASGVIAGRDRIYHWCPAPSGNQNLRQIHYDAVGTCLQNSDGVSIRALDGNRHIHVSFVGAPEAEAFVAYVKDRVERTRGSAPSAQESVR